MAANTDSDGALKSRRMELVVEQRIMYALGVALGFVVPRLDGVVLLPSIVGIDARVRPTFAWLLVQMEPVALTEDSLVWGASLATVVLEVDFVETILLVAALR